MGQKVIDYLLLLHFHCRMRIQVSDNRYYYGIKLCMGFFYGGWFFGGPF